MLLPWLLTIIATLISTTLADDIVYVTVTTTVGTANTIQATPTVPSPASYTSLDDFKKTVLQVSNDYRKVHDAKPLVWNDTLAKYALNWAEACIWKHSVRILRRLSRKEGETTNYIQDGPYGENLAFGFPNASAAVAAWGDEGEMYNYQKPTGFTEKTGHFTQLVWRSTTEVGCAAINCGYNEGKNRRDTFGTGSYLQSRGADGTMRAQGWYVVCEYSPAGNVVGAHNLYFRLNVLPRRSSENSSTSASGSVLSKAETAGRRVDSTVRMMLMALGTVAIGMGLYT